MGMRKRAAGSTVGRLVAVEAEGMEEQQARQRVPLWLWG